MRSVSFKRANCRCRPSFLTTLQARWSMESSSCSWQIQCGLERSAWMCMDKKRPTGWCMQMNRQVSRWSIRGRSWMSRLRSSKCLAVCWHQARTPSNFSSNWRTMRRQVWSSRTMQSKRSLLPMCRTRLQAISRTVTVVISNTLWNWWSRIVLVIVKCSLISSIIKSRVSAVWDLHRVSKFHLTRLATLRTKRLWYLSRLITQGVALMLRRSLCHWCRHLRWR